QKPVAGRYYRASNFPQRTPYFHDVDHAPTRSGSIESCRHEFERVRSQRVVGVEKSQVFRAGRSNSRIARTREPAILLADVLEGDLAEVRREYLPGVVARPVVYNNQFVVTQALQQNGLYRDRKSVV